MTKQRLFLIIDLLMTKEGYKRQGNKWCKNLSNITSFIYIQRSRWSDQYNLSLRAKINNLESEEKNSYDISIRMESLVNNEYIKAFDLENELSDNIREIKIKEVFNFILPVLSKFESIDGIKEIISEYGNSAITTLNTKKLLNY